MASTKTVPERGITPKTSSNGNGRSTTPKSNGSKNGDNVIDEAKVVITAPNIETVQFHIVGTAPLVQLAFSEKARNIMLEGMAEEQKAGTRKKRKPRKYDEEFVAAQHIAIEGWNGVPAAAFRNAMIAACRLVDFKMTNAKQAVFVKADGFDIDGFGLVKLTGEPKMVQHPVRNANGSADIRTRAMYSSWSCNVTIQYDADQFGREDITNLLARAGLQVGVGEGRPASPKSAGMGWGTFELK